MFVKSVLLGHWSLSLWCRRNCFFTSLHTDIVVSFSFGLNYIFCRYFIWQTDWLLGWCSREENKFLIPPPPDRWERSIKKQKWIKETARPGDFTPVNVSFSCLLHRVVWWLDTTVSEDHAASIFRLKGFLFSWLYFHPFLLLKLFLSSCYKVPHWPGEWWNERCFQDVCNVSIYYPSIVLDGIKKPRVKVLGQPACGPRFEPCPSQSQCSVTFPVRILCLWRRRAHKGLNFICFSF
jgi:hypothetical protein